MTPEQLKHLEFIQAIITRMNSNSFQLKGWAITIVSALLALYASSSNVTYIFIGIVPTLLFWFLDTYYLQLERKFRGLYNYIVNGNTPIISDFKMPIKDFKGGEYHFFKVFISPTISLVYGSIVIALLIGGLILKYKDCVIVIHCQ